MTQSIPRPHPESGNMLVYILGAILLLGILIVASKGNYQPGAGIDQEGLTLKVSQVRRYAAELERGVQFAMQNGISETELRFSHPNALSTYGTYGTNPKAEIFNPAGGGVEWRDPPTGIQVTSSPWTFIGRNQVSGVGSTCTGADKNPCVDLVAFLSDVTQSFCIALNNSAGVTNPSGIPPKETSNINTASAFSGTFSYQTGMNTSGGHTSSKPEACIEATNVNGAAAGGKYYYYKVLLAR